jgi:hypothetical protein
MIHPKLKAWWDAKIAEQEAEIQGARMPASIDDARTAAELMKFTRALPEGSPLFAQQPESPERPTSSEIESQRQDQNEALDYLQKGFPKARIHRAE